MNMQKVKAYYNEFNPKAAAALKQLIVDGLVAPGEVDTRSIEDVSPSDLNGYTQVHFFAGIGGWSYCLRRAGWEDSRPVWSGSCPCQPFSAAGKGAGFADERHLWPTFEYLIGQSGPDTIFGEQVASKDGLAWLDLVQSDLEGQGYAFAAVDLCAAGFGSPHIRQRLDWVAVSENIKLNRGRTAREEWAKFANGGRLGHYKHKGLERYWWDGGIEERWPVALGPVGTTSPLSGSWRDADWLACTDNRSRPVESGTFPLAHGAPERVGRISCYGNAIVIDQTVAFIQATGLV